MICFDVSDIISGSQLQKIMFFTHKQLICCQLDLFTLYLMTVYCVTPCDLKGKRMYGAQTGFGKRQQNMKCVGSVGAEDVILSVAA